MTQLPPFVVWLVIEAGVLCGGLALFWAWNAMRLRRRYEELRRDAQSLIGQIVAAMARLGEVSRSLHGEIERLYSDPSQTQGLDRLESVRAGLRRQKEAVEAMIAARMSADFVMRDAVPALDTALAAYEKNLATVLRQWDSAISAAAPAPARAAESLAPPQSPADEGEAARLASLRSEHEALARMHESLVAAHQEAQDRLRQAQEELARLRNAPAAPIASAAPPESVAAEIESLRRQLARAQARTEELEARIVAAEANEAAYDRLQERVERLESENAQLLADNEALLMDAAVRESSGADDEIGPAQAAQWTAQIEQLKKELEEARAVIGAGGPGAAPAVPTPPPADAAARGSVAELRMQLEIAENTAAEMEAARKKAVDELNRLKEQRQQAQAEFDAQMEKLRAEARQLGRENSQLAADLQATQRELRQSRGAADNLERNVAGLNEEIRKQSQDIKSLKQALQAVTSERDELRRRMERPAAGGGAV